MEFNYANFAASIGLIRVESDDHVGAAWDDALAADRPCVLDSPNRLEVPPLPPRSTFDQPKNFVTSLQDPGRSAIGRDSMKQI